mmetsp:Transcript_14954/g.37303  ORF Transcript_14954/g.37303 Transcript_14954/m.37303 type:complete len:90 (+) Transcript_14954:798-1067(+)
MNNNDLSHHSRCALCSNNGTWGFALCTTCSEPASGEQCANHPHQFATPCHLYPLLLLPGGTADTCTTPHTKVLLATGSTLLHQAGRELE